MARKTFQQFIEPALLDMGYSFRDTVTNARGVQYKVYATEHGMVFAFVPRAGKLRVGAAKNVDNSVPMPANMAKSVLDKANQIVWDKS